MIVIFGGTTEGRLAIDVCEQAGKQFYYSTKSSTQDVEMHNGVRLTGAMTSEDIILFCKEHDIKCIIDAAHPFAENLHKAIADTHIPTIRLQRVYEEHKDSIIYCSDYQEAVSKMCEENIHTLLALSGANTISKLADYWHNHKTIFRILQRPESIDIAKQNNFPTDNLIYYSTSYTLPSKAEEKALMQHIGCDAIITKESGESGGFEAKVEAALELGIKVFVIQAPKPQGQEIVVTGKHGLRRAIEHLVPDFFPLKTGFTTGACATAATKAALLSLLYDDQPEEVSFALPDEEIMSIQVRIEEKGKASVIKDFSDDPDVTKGCKISSSVSLRDDDRIIFLQGEGVGKVTLPGLGIPVGEPAVNITPRNMICGEIRTITDKGVNVCISVDKGAELAKRTFNPKVGVIDGISIIGTSGIVSPLSNEAFIKSIRREMEVAKAIGCKEIALVSGKKSEDFLHRDSNIRCIHYGNFIGESLKNATELGFQKVVLGIMIGKAVKLAEGNLDTHSHKVQMNKEFLKQVAKESLQPSTFNFQPSTFNFQLISPLGGNARGGLSPFNFQPSIDVPPRGERKRGSLPFQLSTLLDSITLARELWNIMPASFFDRITLLCYQHCKTVFPSGELEIKLICDEQQ